MSKRAIVERDLSHIKFNKRVVEEAGNKNAPIFERFKFLSIYASNMREFFMVRVGSMFDDLNRMKDKGKDTDKLEKLLKDIGKDTEWADDFATTTYNQLKADMKESGIDIKDVDKLEGEEEKTVKDHFKKAILPLLSPRLYGKSDTFVHLNTGSIALVVEFEKNSSKLMGVCELPSTIEKAFIARQGKEISVYITEDLMLKYVDKIFMGLKIKRCALVSLTRNADLDADEARKNTRDYRYMLAMLLNRRSLQFPVRLQYKGEFKGDLKETILKDVGFVGNFITEAKIPMDFSFVKPIEHYVVFEGIFNKTTINGFEGKSYRPIDNLEYAEAPSIIELAKKKDLLINTPYNKFSPFLRLMAEASEDKNVKEIKMTLYRVAKNPRVIDYLEQAVQNGKKVTVIIELKARFDEENNIEISRRLQQAGCEVHFGVVGYKVHSKLFSITLKNNQRVSYVGTGNFHEVTAKLYTDLGIITADKTVGEDIDKFFNEIMQKANEIDGEKQRYDYKKLYVTPKHFKDQIIALIDEEIAKVKAKKKGEIIIKCNAMTHKDIIEKLIEASKIGVKVQLIVRGACCILPGVAGITDSLTVRSIVGEFLEHSRIFVFGTGVNRRVIIASCDMMTRNLDHRYEVGIEVEDKDIKKTLINMINIYLKDNVKARVCDSDGNYSFVEVKEGDRHISCQEAFKRMAKSQNLKYKRSLNK